MRNQPNAEEYVDYEFDEDYTDYDDQPAPRSGFRVAGGVFDFIGVMVCTVLILALMALMTALFSWLRGDLSATFSGIGQNLNEAVVIGDQPSGHTVAQPTANP